MSVALCNGSNTTELNIVEWRSTMVCDAALRALLNYVESVPLSLHIIQLSLSPLCVCCVVVVVVVLL